MSETVSSGPRFTFGGKPRKSIVVEETVEENRYGIFGLLMCPLADVICSCSGSNPEELQLQNKGE
jgi:hypothetical protein